MTRRTVKAVVFVVVSLVGVATALLVEWMLSR